MDNFNHNIIEQLEAEVKNKHYHEELVLQGRMVGIRNGHSLNIQGPHDILMAEVQVVTPADIHTLVLQDGNRHTGTFREWDREYTKPNNYQKRLLEMWKQERSWEKAESDKWCMRGHRTTQEAKTCNGTVKPVFELSDPPRVVPRSSGTKKASYRLRSRGETYLSYNMRKNNQKYVPIAPKPKPRSMGKVYHFKAANSNPRATVQMHPIPEASVVHHERGCPLYRPSQPPIQVVGDGPVQSPMKHLTPKAHHSLRAVNNGWEAKQDKRFILGVQHHMDRIDETSKKLLDLFLCKEERQQQFIRTTMKEINEENQLRQWGVTQAKPLQREQPQAPPASPQTAAASQDPAILVIQPAAPSPTSSVSSSLPSLESIPSAAEYDSDCEITSFKQPKKKRVVPKPEPVDPEMEKLEASAQNLKL